MNNTTNPGSQNRLSTTNMGAVVKSPTSLFIWWDIPDNDPTTEEGDSTISWTLCLSEEGKEQKRKIPVDCTDGSYYLDVDPEKTYRVKLGWVEGETFHTERGPVEAQTPSQSPRADDEPEWVDVRTGEPIVPPEQASGKRSAEGEQRAGLDWDEELLGDGASAVLGSSELQEGADGDSGDAQSA
ncbi:MAG: hypothetical protein ACOC0A_01955 [Planctomycetota bacterium]